MTAFIIGAFVLGDLRAVPASGTGLVYRPATIEAITPLAMLISR